MIYLLPKFELSFNHMSIHFDLLSGFIFFLFFHSKLGDYSLKISSVTLEDDATFQCQVGAIDNVPGIRSQNAHLSIQVKPENPVIVWGNYPQNHHHHHQTRYQQPNFNEIPLLSTIAGIKIELVCESFGGRPAAEVGFQSNSTSF